MQRNKTTKTLNIVTNKSPVFFYYSEKLNDISEENYQIFIKKDNLKIDLNYYYIIDKPVLVRHRVNIRALNGSISSKVSLNMKVYLFSDSNIKLLPELEIEESNIEIDHHVSMGSFSREELFYFKSKGISQDSAITLLKTSLMKI